MKNKWFLGEVSVGYKRTDESIFKDTLSKKMMRNSDNVVDFFRAIFPEEVMEHHEEMWVGYLNQNNRPIGFMQLAKGTTARCVDVQCFKGYHNAQSPKWEHGAIRG